MATYLKFSMTLKSGRHVDVAGEFTPYRPSCGSYPGDPPEPADIEVSTCLSDGVNYEPTEDETFEIIDRAEDVYFEGFDMRASLSL